MAENKARAKGGNQKMEMPEQLNRLFDDPEAMSQLSQLAQSLTAGDISNMLGALSMNTEDGAEQSGQTGQSAQHDSGGMPGIAALLGGLGGLGGAGGGSGAQGGGDPKIELLQAIRPFLSGTRKKRVSEAVKILRLLELLPLIQQSGLLGSLMGGDDDG